MNLEQRIDAFVKLGELFKQLINAQQNQIDNSEIKMPFYDEFMMEIDRSQEFNGWFTKENVLKSMEAWGDALSISNLNKWTSKYNFNAIGKPKRIAIIMAGNIPLVGFHDFLSALICGHDVLVKLSSNDKQLLPLVAKFLASVESYFKNKITFTEEKITDFDAVIATGSNNTARYFEHYFRGYPNIIRKNRNAVAILTGKESTEELVLLGNDIFQYFGLGCRSVSKLFVPMNYDFDLLFRALYEFKSIKNYKKYEHNYDYNKAVYLMSLFDILDNGFVMLKEDTGYASPIATIFYEYYDSFDNLYSRLQTESEQIQCIACNENVVDFVKFGQTQSPKLWNYADKVDTIEFLLKI